MRIGGAVSAGGRRRAAHKNGASHRQAVGALLHEVVRARSTRAAAAVGRSCAAALAAVSTAIARLGGLDARGAVVNQKPARRPNAAPAAGIPTARPISLAPRGAPHVRIAASTAAAATATSRACSCFEPSQHGQEEEEEAISTECGGACSRSSKGEEAEEEEYAT